MKKCRFLPLVLFLLGTCSLKAQHLILDQPNTTGIHTASGSITMMSGFSTGHGFHAYTLGWLPNCTALNISPSSNQNYIISYAPNNPFSSSSGFATAGSCDVQVDITYYDGLGRPFQTIQVKGSPLADKDIITPIVYDNYGRETKKYLPYASSSNDGSYKTTALTDVISYYNGGSPAPGYHSSFATPFAETLLESSPASRPREQGAPGAAWQLGSGHTILTSYGSNAAGDVPLWSISGTGAVTTGSYSANMLYRTESTDENGNKSIEYKDKSGQVLLKKVQEGVSTYLSTHYIYDDLGNLRFVLPPAVSPVNFDENSTSFNQFIYAYKYDSRNRLVRKKIPGKGWESLVYDTHDRLIATQDAVQAASSLWTFTKYDKFGRVVQTGEVSDTRDQTALASHVAGLNPNWETASTTDPEGYSRNGWPQSWNKLYTVNYYDGYSFPGHPGSSYNYTAAGINLQVNGLLTASRVRNLETGDMYWTLNYYDSKAQLRETVAQNHIGGLDRIINDYNFSGQLTKMNRSHSSSTVSNLPIITEYHYDHRGRKVEARQKINNGTEVLLSKLVYSPVGQLVTKKLHNETQSTSYTYNERGWLKSQTNPVFNMLLNYEDHTNTALRQYNGNISGQSWGPGSNPVLHNYTYSYDKLNRLTQGSSDEGFNETIDYDVMGNITSLARNPMGINTYDYTGTGNRLNSISGFVNGSYGYDDNGNVTSDGPKGVTLQYNTLNLPRIITKASTSEVMTNIWLATGTKLRKVTGGLTRDYVGGIEYNNGTIEFIHTEEGRARPSGTGYFYEYTLKDHLGNTRVMIDQHGNPLETSDYYPFGLQVSRSGQTVPSPENRYKYNGKELQTELGLNQYDYGARFYDPVIARWNVLDPMSEDYHQLSPYNYGENNPILMIDPTGRNTDTATVKAQLTEVVILVTATVNRTIGGAAGARWGQVGVAAALGWNASQAISKNMYAFSIGIGKILVKLGVDPAKLATPENRSKIVSPDDPDYIPDGKELPWQKGKPPGEGWVWKGKGNPESGQGNWVNPETGQKMHPDFDHPDPKGPHWGLQQPNGEKWDIFPDGRVIPNNK